MCTMIAAKLPLTAAAKGPRGWFPADHAYLAYDHPCTLAAEHALLLDFVREADGPGQRLAVELPLPDAVALRDALTRAIDQATAEDTAVDAARDGVAPDPETLDSASDS